MDERGDSRWAGRNGAKAAIRKQVWSGLAEAQVNVGPVFDRIPNFVGADAAAKRLSELDEWRRARIVKCNPDPPQIPVRLRALYDGKLLFSPVPYLSKGFPYLRIDPDKLAAKGVDFETAATARGSWSMGSRSGLRTCPNSTSVSSAASPSRGLAGERERAPDLRISNRACFANSGSSVLDAARDDCSFLAGRGRFRRSSWRAMTRPCILSPRNSN